MKNVSCLTAIEGACVLTIQFILIINGAEHIIREQATDLMYVAAIGAVWLTLKAHNWIRSQP